MVLFAQDESSSEDEKELNKKLRRRWVLNSQCHRFSDLYISIILYSLLRSIAYYLCTLQLSMASIIRQVGDVSRGDVVSQGDVVSRGDVFRGDVVSRGDVFGGDVVSRGDVFRGDVVSRGDVSRSEVPGVSPLVSSDDDFEEFPHWSSSGVRSEAPASTTSTSNTRSLIFKHACV